MVPVARNSSRLALDVLQVQSLGLAFRLRLHHPLPRRSEIRHLHPHAPLSKRHQPGFGADGFDVCTGEVVLLIDELV